MAAPDTSASELERIKKTLAELAARLAAAPAVSIGCAVRRKVIMLPNKQVLDMVMAVAQESKGAIDPVLGILNVGLAMAHQLNPSQRHLIAERLRSEAVDLDQR